MYEGTYERKSQAAPLEAEVECRNRLRRVSTGAPCAPCRNCVRSPRDTHADAYSVPSKVRAPRIGDAACRGTSKLTYTPCPALRSGVSHSSFTGSVGSVSSTDLPSRSGNVWREASLFGGGDTQGATWETTRSLSLSRGEKGIVGCLRGQQILISGLSKRDLPLPHWREIAPGPSLRNAAL